MNFSFIFLSRIKALIIRIPAKVSSKAEVKSAILSKAEQLDLPVTKKDITIKRTSNRIKITVVYDITIEFPGYTHVWHKEHLHERPLFYG